MDLLIRMAGTQKLLRVGEDVCTIERALAGSQNRSKTIILVRNYCYPAIERRPFVYALQLGALAQMILDQETYRERASNLAREDHVNIAISPNAAKGYEPC
jgi:hypothetical protein